MPNTLCLLHRRCGIFPKIVLENYLTEWRMACAQSTAFLHSDSPIYREPVQFTQLNICNSDDEWKRSSVEVDGLPVWRFGRNEAIPEKRPAGDGSLRSGAALRGEQKQWFSDAPHFVFRRIKRIFTAVWMHGFMPFRIPYPMSNCM